MNETEKQKIKGFISDTIMSTAVKNVLRETFLKKHNSDDVQVLAAERLAINLLEEGFKELNKFSNQQSGLQNSKPQVGL